MMEPKLCEYISEKISKYNLDYDLIENQFSMTWYIHTKGRIYNPITFEAILPPFIYEQNGNVLCLNFDINNDFINYLKSNSFDIINFYKYLKNFFENKYKIIINSVILPDQTELI